MNAHRAQGRRARVALVAVAAVSALAGVGAAALVVVTGPEVGAGKRSPTEVAGALVAAWAAGDGDRAVALMPSYDELMAALDCPRVDERAGRAAHEKLRAEVWAKAQVWRQRRPSARQIAPGDVQARQPDEALGRCRSVTPVAIQPVDVTIELDGRGHGQLDVTLTVVQLGDRWFLMDAGALPSSLESDYTVLVAMRELRRQAREKRAEGRPRRDWDYDDDDHDYDDDDDDDDDDEDAADRSVWVAIGGPSSKIIATVRAIRDATCACKDLECVARTERDLTHFNERYQPSNASDDEHRALQKVRGERTDCIRALRASLAPRTGVPACDEYVRHIEWYMSCDQIPQPAREGMEQGLEAMRQAWGDLDALSDEAREATGESCRAAVDALRQAGAAMGCGNMP